MKLSVADRLKHWFDPEMRELPWKATRDPYSIWLSEVILQQTTVRQGIPYYLKFIDRYPDVHALASAGRDEIMKMWEGLGYYSRARNLHEAAKQVVSEFDGIFPKDHRSLLRLRGVGDYTAAAIASFAYDEAVAVVDGNVFRFLSRLFGITDPIDSPSGKAKFRELANELLDKADPAAHNQAIMDFGSLICRPREPLCETCPFRPDCAAFNEGRIQMLPVKARTAPKKGRRFTYYIMFDEERVIIEKREGKDIWHGLYQFPMIEADLGEADAGAAVVREDGRAYQGADTGAPILAALDEAREINTYPGFRQVLSHQVVHAVFVMAKMDNLGTMTLPPGWEAVPSAHLHAYAFPRLIRKFLDGNSVLLRDPGNS